MSSLDYLGFCRLCLVKNRVFVPIFEGEGDIQQIFLKITTCLPIKVTRDDRLPKKICDDCVYKVELCYQFWNTTANAEKQLLQWLDEVNMEDKQSYVGTVLNPNGVKPEQSNKNRLGGIVMQQVSGHQNNMNIGIMDNLMMSSHTQQQITSISTNNGASSIQNVQSIIKSSMQLTHDQIIQNQRDPSIRQEQENNSKEEKNTNNECGRNESLSSIKENSNNSRIIEPTFVNVSLSCNEAGPSGLQQQKIADISKIIIPQTVDINSKPEDQWTAVWDGYKDQRMIVVLQEESKVTKTKSVLPEHFVKKQELNEELIQENRQTDDVDQMLDNLRGICPTCNKRFSNNRLLEKHVEKFHKRLYKCNLCPKTYVKSCQLNVHKKTHTEIYECTVCGLKFQRPLSLQRHNVRSHSTADRNFTCDYCGKQFKLKSDILVHIINAHSTDRQICHICGQSVRYLKSHERTHLQKRNPKKFSCHLCQRKLATQTKLDNHLLMHREIFHCQECDQECKGPIELARHKRLHQKTAEECKICGKMFARLHLRTHILTHAGLRPYKCDICDADFTQRSSLMRHRKGHPGPLPPPPSVSITQLVQNVLQLFS